MLISEANLLLSFVVGLVKSFYFVFILARVCLIFGKCDRFSFKDCHPSICFS